MNVLLEFCDEILRLRTTIMASLSMDFSPELLDVIYTGDPRTKGHERLLRCWFARVTTFKRW
jgi:hypothetical protein